MYMSSDSNACANSRLMSDINYAIDSINKCTPCDKVYMPIT